MMAWANLASGTKLVQVIHVHRRLRVAAVRFEGRAYNVPTAALVW